MRSVPAGDLVQTRYRLERSLLFVATCAIFASTAGAQPQTPVPAMRRQLVGVVRDASGATLKDVNVGIPGSTTRTNERGAFELFTVDLDTVTISLRHVGFEPIDALISARNRLWDTVVVQLEPSLAARRLADVKVVDNRTRSALGLRDFESRRSSGIGSFVTREEIANIKTSKLSDLLRTKRGVIVTRGRVRFSAYQSKSCQPDVWIDGARSQGNMEVDDLLPSTVEAIELYSSLSTLPLEFQKFGARTTPCGTIVIWSRVPNARNR